MSRVKRERRSEEEDRWDVVDPPEPFTFSVPKERVKDALGGGSRASRTSESDHVRLTPRGLISTLPEMSREEKKRLKEALRQDEECEAWRSLEKHRVLLQEIHQDLHEDMTGYHRTPMSGVSRGSDDQRPLIPRPKPLLQPPKGDKPRPVKERELQEFREALIARQWKDGKLRPSEASPMPTETQARCCHPPDRLRWTANGEGHQARCRVCDLKNVIYFSTRHGVLMVSNEDAQGGDPSELAEDAEKVRRMVHTPPSPGAIQCSSQGEVREELHNLQRFELRGDWSSRAALPDHQESGWRSDRAYARTIRRQDERTSTWRTQAPGH